MSGPWSYQATTPPVPKPRLPNTGGQRLEGRGNLHILYFLPLDSLFIPFAINRLKLAFRQFKMVIFSKGVSWKMFRGLQPQSSCQTLLQRGWGVSFLAPHQVCFTKGQWGSLQAPSLALHCPCETNGPPGMGAASPLATQGESCLAKTQFHHCTGAGRMAATRPHVR